jgi:hypothetical protein
MCFFNVGNYHMSSIKTIPDFRTQEGGAETSKQVCKITYSKEGVRVGRNRPSYHLHNYGKRGGKQLEQLLPLRTDLVFVCNPGIVSRVQLRRCQCS